MMSRKMTSRFAHLPASPQQRQARPEGRRPAFCCNPSLHSHSLPPALQRQCRPPSSTRSGCTSEQPAANHRDKSGHGGKRAGPVTAQRRRLHLPGSVLSPPPRPGLAEPLATQPRAAAPT